MDSVCVNHAIRLNDEGVFNMVEGKDQAAVKLFSDSLSAIFTVLRSDNRGPAPAPPANESTISPIDTPRNTPTASPLYPMDSFVHSKVFPLFGMQKEDDSSFLYCNAVTLCPEDPQQQSRHVALLNKKDDQRMIRVYAASIVFNLALVYHRRGRRNLQQVCFQKALTMYDMVRKLLVAETGLIAACNKSSTGTSLLLLVAAVNNASHIRFYQEDYAQAQEGLQLIGGLFHRYSATIGDAAQEEDIAMNDATRTNPEDRNPNRRRSGRQLLLADHEMRGFLLNILLLCPPSLAAAA